MNPDTCTRCHGTQVLMKADYTGFTRCPDCTPDEDNKQR